MSPPKGTIITYLHPNYEGVAFEMKVPVRHSNANFEIRSVKVGPETTLCVSEKSGKVVKFKSGDHPEIRIPYESILQGIDVVFEFSIDIRFKHSIASEPADNYDLTIKPLHFDNTVIQSGGDYVGVQIPKLSPPDSLIVSQISVREKPWPHQIVANGSVYFKYNPVNHDISFQITNGLPANISIVKDDIWGFTISLNSINK
ncbi:putative calcium-dependent cell adhesion molecule-3 [Cavenderia fasciculata]|uniref:Calcium-dependent cell adhesion molecule-3 n=1 Tax=Cavenderia fasciculata TaxID=261658 RepID=F4Q1F6_CACFS|nr:putative calcium-dependent cell adhesion molecule-3 [Cavenderia fasciculata]EGG18657.1 putative calcium-dependent cell adhesion molecule-3 [Cavenderia fasciculata]|eukprot:XP_004366561.1 putative calcium-dependent cell adhesion molecule-3 [Cavenderia fasciculata]